MTKIKALELELAARKMAKNTELHWWKLIKFVGSNNSVIDYAHLDRYNSEYLELALGVVEGKPVWAGDEYYDTSSSKIIARSGLPKDYWDRCSWLQPKSKTVMVELLVADAQNLAKWKSECRTPLSIRVSEACRKALEELK